MVAGIKSLKMGEAISKCCLGLVDLAPALLGMDQPAGSP